MPRIIAGTLGGRPVPGTVAKGTRPTSDRVREALFSRLTGWDALAGARVLDLYAGTGALAFEALSRGAASALLVETHAPTARSLRAAAVELGLAERCEVRAGKAETVAAQVAAAHLAPAPAPVPHPFLPADLVFLDPPYDVDTAVLEDLLVTLAPALAEEALVVIERSSRTRPIAWPEGWGDDGTKTYGETVLQYGGPLAP